MSPDLPPSTGRRIRLGISACLFGDEVRYDGGHKRDQSLIDLFGPQVEWVKVCPEVEIGMGTPREPIQLVDERGAIRLLGVTSGVDHTTAMTTYAANKVEALADEDLSGYILKTASPSCGMAGVAVHGREGGVSRTGVGLFAQALLARFPDLPVEEEGHLADSRRRTQFLEQVLAYHHRRHR
jgi:uncharacterized protein YbbK (DUF523 family)